MNRIATGESVPGVKQDKSLVTKAPKLTKEHGLIDWKRTAEQVCNHIRAMQPWPTAYTFLHRAGQPPLRLIVPATRLASGEASQPGLVRTDLAVQQLFVDCSAGSAVEILELQPAGKRRMAVTEFLRGNALPPGARMGPEAD